MLVDHRAAAVALIDAGVDLQDLAVGPVDDAGNRAADDLDAVAQHARKRIADRADFLPEFDGVRIGQGERRQIRGFDVHERHVVRFVLRDDAAFVLFVADRHFDLGGVLDDVPQVIK